MKKVFFLALMVLLAVSILASPAFAASSTWGKIIPLGGEKYLQVRGVDKPHSFKNFSSWPGYSSFVHNNCYHVHGEFKKISSKTGREYYSTSVSIPLYCKGATKYIGKAFKYAAGELDLSVIKFLKVGGILVTVLMQIPSVGQGSDQFCNQNKTTNSTYCTWQE